MKKPDTAPTTDDHRLKINLTRIDKETEQFVSVFRKLDNLENIDPSKRAKIKKLLEKNYDEWAKQNFYVFVRRAAHLILPDKFMDGKHIHIYCRSLQKLAWRIENNYSAKLQLWLPPGSMKTTILILFVAWCLGKNPSWPILHIGHGIKFAENTFGKPIQDVITTEDFKAIFPECVLDSDSTARGDWRTTKRGRYIASGAGTPQAGKRGKIIICDDVVHEQTSPSELLKLGEWYTKGLRSRGLGDHFGEIIVNTRWYTNDLSGQIIDIDAKARAKQLKEGERRGKALTEPWEIIKIPAILDKDGAILLGYEEGSSFWPEMFTIEALLAKKSTFLVKDWNALYQQSPVEDEGNIFKTTHFSRVFDNDEALPELDRIILSFDTAFSEKSTADFSAWTVWGTFQQVVDDAKGHEVRRDCVVQLERNKKQYSYPALRSKIIELCAQYKPDVIIVENKASGQSIVQELQQLGLPIFPYQPDRDKVARAHSVLPLFENGTVYFKKDPQFETYKVEMLQFPAGRFKDYVDTTTQALIYLKRANLIGRDDVVRYMYEDDDEDDYRPSSRKTYWQSAASKRKK